MGELEGESRFIQDRPDDPLLQRAEGHGCRCSSFIWPPSSIPQRCFGTPDQELHAPRRGFQHPESYSTPRFGNRNHAINDITKDNVSRTIIFYANQMLRTIAICHRDFESWPPPGTHFQSPDEVSYDDLSCDMTLVAITGILCPLCSRCRRRGSRHHQFDDYGRRSLEPQP